MAGVGVIVSESTPDTTNRYTWIKPTTSGLEIYELADGSGWVKVATLPAQLGDIIVNTALHLAGDIYATGSTQHQGINKQITIDGKVAKFKKGLLVDYS